MISRVVHKWMRNISPEMLLLVPMLWFLPLTGAAPSVTTEQLDTGVVSFLPFLLRGLEVLLLTATFGHGGVGSLST